MKKIVIISGPTAVGKTSISIKMAHRLNGEIISADSMQVYKGMDIGSAKIKPDEMEGIRHHLIDILEPDRDFNVQIFQKLAGEAIEDICKRGKLPIIVGGTAFYIQALLYGIDFTEEDHDDSYRNKLNELSEDELYERLDQIDHEYAKTTHKNNKKRVIRALEYNHFTGRKFSEYNTEQSQRKAIYDYRYFVMNDKRENIYASIDRRVDIMMDNGLLDEVVRLNELNLPKECNSRQGIGYKELFEYLDGRCSLEEAIENIKKNTRHFAKRQLTWLKHEDDTIFINKDEYNYDEELMLDFMISKFEER
ncbi:MAG: tRNA (adenosine(37)-N6)-dimethylallyltransferase MiaA [Lachnospiraceae bacterium]|nr:tRNA (adenosine(37)-N6)-dimethylallyltransferase MiaA [Lachnospiraceae bacterium]